MNNEIDLGITNLVAEMRLNSEHLSRQSQDAARRLGMTEGMVDELRQGEWVGVANCCRSIGRYYFIRRTWSNIGFTDAPCLAEWGRGGWNVLWGKFFSTPSPAAAIEQWCNRTENES